MARCKKDQLKMTINVSIVTKDYKGKALKRGNAEKNLEQLLCKVFKVYVENFGKRIAIKYPDIVEVLADAA